MGTENRASEISFIMILVLLDWEIRMCCEIRNLTGLVRVPIYRRWYPYITVFIFFYIHKYFVRNPIYFFEI